MSYSNFFVFCLTVEAITPTPQHQLLACCKLCCCCWGNSFEDFELRSFRVPELHEGRHPIPKLPESRSPPRSPFSPASDFNIPPFLFRCFRMRLVHEAHLPLSTPALSSESRQNPSSVAVTSFTMLPRIFVDKLLVRNFKFPAKSLRTVSLCSCCSSSLSPRLSSQECSRR